MLINPYKFILFVLSIRSGLIVSARTDIKIYRDYDCKEQIGEVQTYYIAIDGDCLAVPKGAHSVKTIHVDNPCGGASLRRRQWHRGSR